ncbi:hypothetical protein B484DRAFT_444392 [Ochromonadaceae sp. CCMP2298]|nr:hypothetical protein B484DRAFT_444392 [Ochromonadaceae sp. CCMP2298]|mmetsp:Transcript_9108/g.20060  ORF Transcript_9108/g.20060 Transcript_9108/m.20060 type:complete len:340 (-) Transcript_9108:329-1348(-)
MKTICIAVIALCVLLRVCEAFSSSRRSPTSFSRVHQQLLAPTYAAAPKDASGLMDDLYTLLKQESIGSLLPKEDLITMIQECRSNDVIMLKVRERFLHVWKYFHALVYNENRALREIMGPELSEKVLRVAEKLDIYDHRTVRSFIQTPAFSHVLSGVFYEMFFDMGKKVDVLGRIVNRVPIVGPIRASVGRGVKRGLDKTLGVRFKRSLAPRLTEDSIKRLADFMVSQQNRSPFESINRNIVDGIISRPLSTIFPNDKEQIEKMRAAAWSMLTETPPDEIFPLISLFYDNVAQTKLSEMMTVNFDPTLAGRSTSVSNGGRTVFTTDLNKKTVINIIVKV